MTDNIFDEQYEIFKNVVEWPIEDSGVDKRAAAFDYARKKLDLDYQISNLYEQYNVMVAKITQAVEREGEPIKSRIKELEDQRDNLLKDQG